MAEVRELKTSTVTQLDNSNALSPNKIELHDHSSYILFYNIIIHFNRRSVSISPLTCLFYRREVSFTIHNSPTLCEPLLLALLHLPRFALSRGQIMTSWEGRQNFLLLVFSRNDIVDS